MNSSSEFPPEPPNLNGVRILVVEDSWQVGMAVTTLLESLGAEVSGPAATSADALGLVSARRPDVALVDFSLRFGDLADGLIERLHEQGIPVVVMTGYTVLPVVLSHSVTVLHKPITEAALFDSLQRVIARKAQR